MPLSRRRSPVLPAIHPIAPALRPVPFSHPDWIFEPKYDGFRGVFYLAPRVAVFGSKRGNTLPRFWPLADQLSTLLGVKSAILDGEVVALDDEGRQDFGLLLRGEGRLHYAAFDLLWLNGRDLRHLPLVKRQERLARLIPETTTVLSPVLVVDEQGRALFQAVQQLDLEGIVAKRKADPYRRETLVQDQEPGVHPGRGRWELFQKPRGR